MNQNLYVTLGVATNASAAEIRAAYLRLMREYHPDRNSSPEAGERARTVIAAFKVLSDFDQRSHYDWARRRDRERAVAEMTVPNRTLDKKAVVVGGAGAAIVGMAMVAWSAIMPPAEALVETTQARRTLPVADARPVPSASAPADRKSLRNAGRDQTIIRMRPILPLDGDRKLADRAKPITVTRAKSTVKAAERNLDERVVKPPTKPVEPLLVRVAPKPGLARTVPPKTVTAPVTDLAALDQFVMSFYGQSWRFGDSKKRSALEQSRNGFVARRGACLADACKRSAYLDLQRDISAIVESGAPAR